MMDVTRRGTLGVLLALACAATSGCGQQGGSSNNDDGGGAQMGEAVVTIAAGPLAAADVTRVEVAVSGPGISPDIVSDLPFSAGQWSSTIGGIRVGMGRTFTGRAYDSAGTLIYQGQATGVTITAGVAASVGIVLQQVGVPDPFRNNAPRITALVSTATQVGQGETATVTVTAVDADGDPLNYAWTASGGTLAGADTASATWTAPATDGPYTLSVTVEDGRGGQAAISMTLFVGSGTASATVSVTFNVWPVVSRVAATPSQLAPGQSTNLSVTATDADGDALTYNWFDDCGGRFSNPTAQSPVWIAPAIAQPPLPVPTGDCTLTVTVSDGRGGSGRGELVAHIGLPPVPGAPPSMPPIIESSFQSTYAGPPGSPVNLMVMAHDPTGAALSFTWSVSGGALSVLPSSGSQSNAVWTLPFTNGTFTATVLVRDASGAEVARTFTVVVG